MLQLSLELLVPTARPHAKDSRAFCAVNGDQRSGARAAAEWLGSSLPDVLFVQEARFFDDEAAGRHAMGRQHRPSICARPCATRSDSRQAVSGGVGVLVANRVGLSHAALVDAAWAHRVLLRRAHLGGGASVIMVSLCVVTSIGLEGEKLGLLEHAASLLGQFCEPFLIGTDWNISPEVLLASQRVDQLGGVALASDSPTCSGSESDYFVASATLGHRATGMRTWRRPLAPARMSRGACWTPGSCPRLRRKIGAEASPCQRRRPS